MLILDPGKIRDEKKKTEQETQARILNLQHEEAEANRRTNIARETEKQEKNRIITANESEILELEAKKANLLSIVTSLEFRRVAAMKPVEELQNEAQKLIFENQKQTVLLQEKIDLITQDHDKLLERLDEQDEDATQLKEELAKVEKLKNGLISSNAEIKRSADELAAKWVTYYAEVTKNNTEQLKIKSENDTISRANDIRAQELYRIAAEQLDHDRGIQDKYKTLQSAVEEAQRKYGIKI